jgi:hypothetical protein
LNGKWRMENGEWNRQRSRMKSKMMRIRLELARVTPTCGAQAQFPLWNRTLYFCVSFFLLFHFSSFRFASFRFDWFRSFDLFCFRFSLSYFQTYIDAHSPLHRPDSFPLNFTQSLTHRRISPWRRACRPIIVVWSKGSPGSRDGFRLTSKVDENESPWNGDSKNDGRKGGQLISHRDK